VHLLIVGAVASLLAVVLIPTGLLLADVVWTRVLQAKPLTSPEASLLGLDPALSVHVSTLAPDVRRAIATRSVEAIVVLSLGTAVLAVALIYYALWILQRLNQSLRLAVLDRLQTLSLRYHVEHRVGDAIYRLYQDSAMVTQLVGAVVLTPISIVGRFVLSLAVVFAYDRRLAAMLAILWPVTAALAVVWSPRMRGEFRAAREAQSALLARAQEYIAGIRVLKAYGAEPSTADGFARHSDAAFATAGRARNLFARFAVAGFWCAGGAALGATGWATAATRDGTPLAGRVLAVFGFTVWNLGLYNSFKSTFGMGTNAVRATFVTWARVQDIAVGLDRTLELLDRQPDVVDAPGAVALPPVGRGVTFREVGFGYDPARPVLEGVTFDAPLGSVTAIVGPTGAGKTTLMALLLRLFDPDRGVVAIDDRDIRTVTLDSLRRNVAIALQENVLFATTVRENIRCAAPTATDAEVRAAAEIACADEFIEALPGGYDTLLGERGAKLSSGQRQRLSIARALLKRSPILVLDEPTAALDAETEHQLLDNLVRWGRDRAILWVTHRLSTIHRAARIVVLSDGRALEQGSHAELMARENGVYRRLATGEAAGAGLDA